MEKVASALKNRKRKKGRDHLKVKENGHNYPVSADCKIFHKACKRMKVRQ